VRVAVRCISQIRGWPLFFDGGRVWRCVSLLLRYGRHEACILVEVVVLMVVDQTSANGGGFALHHRIMVSLTVKEINEGLVVVP